MAKEYEHRGCRIRHEHGGVGMVWSAYAPDERATRLVSERTLKAAKDALDRLWEQGVRW